MNNQKIGVLLLNLGGPDSLEAVPSFLLNLFSDPDIFRFPLGWITQPLFARMITRARSKKVQEYYRLIGGRSPLLALTRAQAIALRAELRRRGVAVEFAIAMRYWRPFTDDALEELEHRGVNRLIVLPLYPQYSLATTESSVKELKKCLARRNSSLKPEVVEPYHLDDGYLDSLSDRLEEGLRRCARDGGGEVEILVSAHGLPESFIRRGDPYQRQIKEDVAALMHRFPDRKFHLSYQSRVGPVKWIGPSTDEMLRELGLAGVKRLLVVPISFVSDHIETLYEIDLLYGEQARRAGITYFRRIRSLNGSPLFIRALASLVEKKIRA